MSKQWLQMYLKDMVGTEVTLIRCGKERPATLEDVRQDRYRVTYTEKTFGGKTMEVSQWIDLNDEDYDIK